MTQWDRRLIGPKLRILQDDYLESLKQRWFNTSHDCVPLAKVIPELDQWFRSTKVNDLQGWNQLPYLDITMGNTHWIESLILRLGLDGFQILHDEYAYYSFMGKWGIVDIDQLEPNKPLMITLPHYKWGGMRPEWEDVLKICEQRNIDIHIDMAWVTLAKNTKIDFAHPNILSVGMSMSKYNLQWNRVGLRYSKQRTMDSITMFNHYYQPDTNSNHSSCAKFMIENLDRDYGWETYRDANRDICLDLGLESTDLVHVAFDPSIEKMVGITPLLAQCCPYSKN